MCLYMTFPLDAASVPNTVAKPATAASASPLYRFQFTSATDYEVEANAVRNGVYAATGPHASERAIGAMNPASSSSTANNHVQLDSETMLKTTMAVLPTTEHDSKMVGATTKSHHYAFTTCENVGACTFAGAVVGHTCTGTDRGQAAKGFCYESSTGSLQCGRAIEVFSRFSTTPMALPYSLTSTISRCPAGAPLTYPGKITTRSLLIGGCMIASDPNFHATAMIHVPEACATTADHSPGCMFPGARNYAPGAMQSSKCLYQINGCTSSTALNYNSEASVNDGSCIEPVLGCTLANSGYAGVATDTPMYQGRYVGLARPNSGQTGRMGLVPYAAYGSVLNYTSGANVLSQFGCGVAVEGCTEPAAANYDPLATVNTNTWCIPVVNGCMMPSHATISTATAAAAGRAHMKDGGTTTYAPLATVNVKTTCILFRLGCTATSAINYDVHATVDDGSCWYSNAGCLDRSALNFNCTLVAYSMCTPTRVDAPTTHDAGRCRYALPPPTPPPPYPPGAAVREVLKVAMTLAGTLSDFPESKIAQLSQAVADRLNIDVVRVTAIITAGSVNVEFQIVTDGAAEASSFTTTLASDLASPAAASSFFATAGVTGVEVVSTPTLEVAIVTYAAPPSPPPEGATGAIVGGIIGVIVGILLLGGLAMVVMKRRGGSKATYPA